jgi:hypothetical protein
MAPSLARKSFSFSNDVAHPDTAGWEPVIEAEVLWGCAVVWQCICGTLHPMERRWRWCPKRWSWKLSTTSPVKTVRASPSTRVSKSSQTHVYDPFVLWLFVRRNVQSLDVFKGKQVGVYLHASVSGHSLVNSWCIERICIRLYTSRFESSKASYRLRNDIQTAHETITPLHPLFPNHTHEHCIAGAHES